jgi:hypothetical protein
MYDSIFPQPSPVGERSDKAPVDCAISGANTNRNDGASS